MHAADHSLAQQDLSAGHTVAYVLTRAERPEAAGVPSPWNGSVALEADRATAATSPQQTGGPPSADAAPVLASIDRAVADLRRGQVVVVRTAAKSPAAVLVHAAETATPEDLERLASLGRSVPALAVTRRRAEVLGLVEPTMDAGGAVLLRPAGGRPADALLFRDLADPARSGAAAAVEPPPVAVIPVPARSPADAAIELAKLARLLPAAIVVAIDPATAGSLAERERAVLLEAEDVFTYHAVAARALRRVAEARVPLADAEDARIVAFRPADGGLEHLAIVVGMPDPADPVLARIHSECFTGDLLGSLRCDCGDQLRGAIAAIAKAGGGVLLYLAQEGRGIGLVNKLRAYQLQDRGFDTVDANVQLGFAADERIYLPAVEMLRQLGFDRVRLLTNNPEKVAALDRCGIAVVERVPHAFPSNSHNEHYLRTKATRSGHLL